MPVTDKQQELDIPSLRVDENQQDESRQTGKSAGSSASGASTSGSQSSSQSKKKDIKSKVTPMSHISGVKRALSHTNSFAGDRPPRYGVDTPKEEELGQVSHRARARPRARVDRRPLPCRSYSRTFAGNRFPFLTL